MTTKAELIAAQLMDANLTYRSFGALYWATTYGAVADGVTDYTSAVQAAMDAALAAGGGTVFIPFNVVYTMQSLTFKRNVTLMDFSNGQFVRFIMNGFNVSGAVNEFYMEAPFHAAIIAKTYPDQPMDPLGPGQVRSKRTSFLLQVGMGDGSLRDMFQMVADINAEMIEDVTLYSPSHSKRFITMHENGRMTYGQNSAQVWNKQGIGEFYHMLYGGSAAIISAGASAPTLALMNEAGTRRRVFDVESDNSVALVNKAGTEVSWNVTDNGNGIYKRGVTGGAFTTTNRNALPTTLAIGSMVYDTTLGKPVWLHSAAPNIWHDATGATV